MPRRRQLKPVRACNIHLKKAHPEEWQWWFRGYRDIPAALWCVRKMPQGTLRTALWRVTSSRTQPVFYRTLREAREYIASQYGNAYH